MYQNICIYLITSVTVIVFFSLELAESAAARLFGSVFLVPVQTHPFR